MLNWYHTVMLSSKACVFSFQILCSSVTEQCSHKTCWHTFKCNNAINIWHNKIHHDLMAATTKFCSTLKTATSKCLTEKSSRRYTTPLFCQSKMKLLIPTVIVCVWQTRQQKQSSHCSKHLLCNIESRCWHHKCIM